MTSITLNESKAQGVSPSSPLELEIAITWFPNKFAKSKREITQSMRGLAERIPELSAANKEKLPWIKLATFGDNKTRMANCYRNNDNVRTITGVEADYDAGKITPERAQRALSDAGLAALIYTTPSHRQPGKGNRWRVLCPTSGPLPADAREDLMARLNGVFNGALDKASFTLSQAYYAGNVKGGTPVETHLVDGDYIDRMEGLEPVYKTGTKAKPKRHTGATDKTGLSWPRFTDALMALPNGGDEYADRDDWLKIGMAVHAESDGIEEGRDAWHGWSERWPGYDPMDTDAAWDSFQSGGVSGSTVLYEAGRYDWTESLKPEELDTMLDECWTPEELDAIAQEALDAQTQADIEELIGRPSTPVARLDWGTPMMNGNKPILNLHNTTVYLGGNLDSILPGLGHNQMSHRDEWSDGQLTDTTISLARIALERRGLEKVGKELVADAARLVAEKRAFHPVRDYLKSHQWDGTLRLDNWLVRHAGAYDSPYTRAVGRKFLIAMVARVMLPGCKHDHTLVLSGAQGQNKSSACRVLAGPDYFSDTLPSIRGDKTDAIRHLQGKWLVELAEMAPARKSEAEDLKAFLSGAVDRVRLPYAKFDEAFPRQCVFIGTTNDDEFLSDVTGGRRFWPVVVTQRINVGALAAERDQLFAEAVAAYSADEPWWLSPEFEAEYAAPEQAAAQVTDTWVEIISEWLERPEGFGTAGLTETTVARVLSAALGMENGGSHFMAQQKRAASVLKQIGWVKTKSNGKMIWRRPK